MCHLHPSANGCGALVAGNMKATSTLFICICYPRWNDAKLVEYLPSFPLKLHHVNPQSVERGKMNILNLNTFWKEDFFATSCYDLGSGQQVYFYIIILIKMLQTCIMLLALLKWASVCYILSFINHTWVIKGRLIRHNSILSACICLAAVLYKEPTVLISCRVLSRSL